MADHEQEPAPSFGGAGLAAIRAYTDAKRQREADLQDALAKAMAARQTTNDEREDQR